MVSSTVLQRFGFLAAEPLVLRPCEAAVGGVVVLIILCVIVGLLISRRRRNGGNQPQHQYQHQLPPQPLPPSQETMEYQKVQPMSPVLSPVTANLPYNPSTSPNPMFNPPTSPNPVFNPPAGLNPQFTPGPNPQFPPGPNPPFPAPPGPNPPFNGAYYVSFPHSRSKRRPF